MRLGARNARDILSLPARRARMVVSEKAASVVEASLCKSHPIVGGEPAA